ncbi:MAG: hypothetical protein ACLFPE_13610 [Bacteroidales bacterium]
MKTIICIFSFGLILWPYLLPAQQPQKTSLPQVADKQEAFEPAGMQLLKNTGGSVASKAQFRWETGAYLNAQWQNGLILMKDGNAVRDHRFRYNLYTQQMEFTDGSDTLAIANQEDIDLLRIGDRVFVYTNYFCDAKEKSGYFELLEDGNCRLLKRWTASLHKAEGEDAGVDCREDMFCKECNCFLQFGETMAKPVSLKREDFVQLFGDDAGRMNRFIRKNKLKVRDQEDLRNIIAFYNHITAIE